MKKKAKPSKEYRAYQALLNQYRAMDQKGKRIAKLLIRAQKEKQNVSLK